MREVILDTETTGLNPKGGDRIIEIGCVELVNLKPTGKTYQTYLDPERAVSEKTIEITGITDEMLVGQPKFMDVVDDFLAFIGNAPLVIHNAEFDMGFINAELARAGRALLTQNPVTDTVSMARMKFPGAPASLDALCRRFKVDNTIREKHGALLDAELLAEVYLHLMGGDQPDLIYDPEAAPRKPNREGGVRETHRPQRRRPQALSPRLTDEEREAHASFLAALPVSAMWNH